MKRIGNCFCVAFCIYFISLLTSCHRQEKSDAVIPESSISIIDDSTYTITDNSIAEIYCRINKFSMETIFSLDVNPKPSFPFRLSIDGATAMSNGLTFHISYSPNIPGNSSYLLEQSSSLVWNVDSANISLTKMSGNTVIGSYYLWLRSGIGTKAVSGTINCYQANIQ